MDQSLWESSFCHLFEVAEAISLANMLKVSNDFLAFCLSLFLHRRKLWKINTWWQLGKQKWVSHHCPSGDPPPWFFFFFFPSRGVQNWGQYSCSNLKTSSAFCISQLLCLCSLVTALCCLQKVACLFGSREPTSLLWTVITEHTVSGEKLKWEE